MDRQILELVKDFEQWQGNTFTLANLIVEAQKELDRQKLTDAGFPEAAELL